LTHWLEYSRGGQGARCRLLQVLPSDPDRLELDMTLDLSGLKIDNAKVTAELGYQRSFGQAAVCVTYTPATAPGLW
jgi:hypothetical protein